MTLETTVVEAFAQSHDLEFVVLYGSRARGTAYSDSDYDVAVMPVAWDGDQDPLALSLQLSQDLARGDVQLAWLPHASWLLSAHVARDGVLLCETTPGAFRRFRVAASLEASDSDLWRHRQLEGIRRSTQKAPSVDKDLVRQELAQLRQILTELRDMLDVPESAYVTEVMRLRATERNLMLLVEYAASINAEVASGAGIPPSDYYSSFFSAAQAGWIDHELATNLAALVPLRNELVHAYHKVRIGSVYQRCRAAMPAWESYVSAILERLDPH